EAQDVYEWEASGVGDCAQAEGCLSLLSSGRGSRVTVSGEEVPATLLYSVSPDGHDVFILTRERLLPQDESNGAGAIYDARIDGGFPAPEQAEASCSGDECQGLPAMSPSLPGPASAGLLGKANVRPRHCRGRHHHTRRKTTRCRHAHRGKRR